jgi:hypothetical protein
MANNFLPFGAAGGANVVSQAAWAALAARTAGFSAGIANSEELNKAWRQSAWIAYLHAQMICDVTGLDMLDDGDAVTGLATVKAGHKGRLIGVQVFDANGTYTPTSGTASVIVEAVGGGGGGAGAVIAGPGNAASGVAGGSGAYGKARFTSLFSGVSVVIGAAGTAGTGAGGGDGGATSFGTLLSCPGGKGGSAGVAQVGGASGGNGNLSGLPTGSPGANILAAQGMTGGVSFGIVSVGQVSIGGAGGNSLMGAGGVPGQANLTGGAASGPGGGGGGTIGMENSSTLTGGVGFKGKVIVYEYA